MVTAKASAKNSTGNAVINTSGRKRYGCQVELKMGKITSVVPFSQASSTYPVFGIA